MGGDLKVKIPGAVSVLLCLCGFVFGIEDFCSMNVYSNNENYMQFTKEPSYAEYAVVGSFKGLHCCAKGYRSIEWYKDGRPYPWPDTVSQLIIYPESANQTVYTQTVTADDNGNYTCLIRNDSIVIAHTMELKVFDKVPDDPKITYMSDDVAVGLGHSVRLFCEAFVGLIDLPDAHNEAVWRKAGVNGTIHDEPRVRQEKVSREDGQTFGTYLIIEEIVEDDYGEYICKISKPGKTINLPLNISEKVEVEWLNPNPIPWSKMLIWSAIMVLVLLTALVLNLQFGLPARVHFKDRFGPLENNDNKANDILILYSQKDSEIALGVLLPTLESKYFYKCGSKELPNNVNTWITHLSDASLKSRRLVAVISPASLNDKWDATSLYQALKQLQSLSPKLTCVFLKEMPSFEKQVKNSQGETLSTLIHNIHIIMWERSKDDRFWLSLRLKLPPKRNNGITIENVNVTQSGTATRLTSNNEESLDNFV